MFSGDDGRTWKPIVPVKKCAECGAREGEIHDEWLHRPPVWQSLLSVTNERIYNGQVPPRPSRCSFRPQLTDA